MNANWNWEPLWVRMLDGASSGIDAFGDAGEVLGFIGDAAGVVLSALLEICSGL